MSSFRERFRVLTALSLLTLTATTADAQLREQQIIQSSSKIIDEIMSIRLRGIPEAMLADAEGIAIIPNVIKASFGVGGRHGKGVLLIRDDHGNWQMPVFVSITGGNFGWQIGVQSTDLILVFKTRKSIQGILNGKLTLGGDLAVAAGPVGREAAAATDVTLRAEIYSYSRSRGLFAGASIDGSVLLVEPDLNAAYYAWRETVAIPPSEDPAIQLVAKIASYREARQPANTLGPLFAPLSAESPIRENPPALGTPALARSEENLRIQLAETASGMLKLLDPSWQTYLALPAEVYREGSHPSAAALAETLGRYDRVAQDPNYGTLATRREFQAAHALLREYQHVIAADAPVLPLPAPPAELSPSR